MQWNICLAITLVALSGAAACTRVPELESKVTPQMRAAPFPELIPLEERLGPALDPSREAQDLNEQLNARSQALQNRARQLQAPIVDEAARKRLETEIEQNPL